MKRLLLLILVAIVVAGCGQSDKNNVNNNNNANNVENNENEEPSNLNKDNNDNQNDQETNDDTTNETNNNNDDLMSGNDDNDTNQTSSEADGDKADLTLQLTKIDEEAGTVIEENDVYQELNKFVKANPKHGEANDLSIYVVNTLHNDQGDHLILLAINRLDKPVKNISFNYTLGTNDGELIFDQEPIVIGENDFGEIEVNHAMPFTLQVNEDQLEIMKKIDDQNQHIEFDNVNLDFGGEE